jgi:hypothetical protein
MVWVNEWQRDLADAAEAARGVAERLERVPEVREARSHAEELELRAHKRPAPGEEYERPKFSEAAIAAGLPEELELAWQRYREVVEKHRPVAEREEKEAAPRYREVREFADRAGETLRKRSSEMSTAKKRLCECERWAKEERETWRGKHGVRAWLHERGVLRAGVLVRIDGAVERARAETARATEVWEVARGESQKASGRYATLVEKYRSEVEREYQAGKLQREQGRAGLDALESVRGASDRANGARIDAELGRGDSERLDGRAALEAFWSGREW